MTYRSHIGFAFDAPLSPADVFRVFDSMNYNTFHRHCRIGRIVLKGK